MKYLNGNKLELAFLTIREKKTERNSQSKIAKAKSNNIIYIENQLKLALCDLFRQKEHLQATGCNWSNYVRF